MSLKVYKYKITDPDGTAHQFCGRSLSVGLDTADAYPVVWAEVNPDREPDTHEYRFYGTGLPLGSDLADWKFLGTASGVSPYAGHFLAWHVFEKLA